MTITVTCFSAPEVSCLPCPNTVVPPSFSHSFPQQIFTNVRVQAALLAQCMLAPLMLLFALAALMLMHAPLAMAQSDAYDEDFDASIAPLPAVEGILRDRHQVPVAAADIYIKSSGAASSVVSQTDEYGRYRVYDLPLGDIIVVARDPVSQAMSQVTGQLQRYEQQLSMDLQLANADARLEGVILHEGKPVAHAKVSVFGKQVFSDIGMVQRNAQTDANGHFAFEYLMPGAQRLVVDHQGVFGQKEVELRPGSSQAIQLSLGNSIGLPNQLVGSNGNRFDIDWNFSLFNARQLTIPQYKGAYALRINGWHFPGMSAAQLSADKREWRLAPVQIDGIEVSRQIFMPCSGQYLRFVENFRNPGETERTVKIRVSGELGAKGRTRILLSPDDTDSQYALTGDSEQNQVLGHVFSGFRSDTSTDATFHEDGRFSYTWELSLPPGASASLMHFALQDMQGDLDQLEAKAKDLVALRQLDMLQGLSMLQRASIKNFVLTR